MKVQVLLPLTIFVSLALLGVIKLRKKEHESKIRLSKFNEIKLRVTLDVLDDILNEKKETESLLENNQGVQKLLEEELNTFRDKAEDTKGYVDKCMGDEKTEIDKLVKAESDLKNLKDESDKERSSWQTEETALKQKIAERSSVCDFLKKDAQLPGNMCGTQAVGEAAKQEEPKGEAPKQEEPKGEAPKQEEPKGEAPKQEEPKGEAPKQEEPKGEAPKQEEPKGEAPKIK
ncbi:uncharacterized protein [Brachyistius frenatus]|uniref:uncharacterized protein n=1 Tax=Brachyistius frenatus TaxID=100188 RepID=UPI0037E722B8